MPLATALLDKAEADGADEKRPVEAHTMKARPAAAAGHEVVDYQVEEHSARDNQVEEHAAEKPAADTTRARGRHALSSAR